jgi:hypothetical protein
MGMDVVPLSVMSKLFRERSVIPFLGSAASVVGSTENQTVLSVTKLSQHLAEIGKYPGSASDPLT